MERSRWRQYLNYICYGKQEYIRSSSDDTTTINDYPINPTSSEDQQ